MTDEVCHAKVGGLAAKVTDQALALAGGAYEEDEPPFLELLPHLGVRRAHDALDVLAVAEAPELVGALHAEVPDLQAARGALGARELPPVQVPRAEDDPALVEDGLRDRGERPTRGALRQDLCVVVLYEVGPLRPGLARLDVEDGAGLLAKAAVDAGLGVDDRVLAALRVVFHGYAALGAPLRARGASAALRLVGNVDHLGP